MLEPWNDSPEDASSSRRALRRVDTNPPPRPVALLPKALRPREKVLAGGAGRLGAAELLSLVLGSGTREEAAWQVADRLVRRHGVNGLAKVSAADLAREKGLGRPTAARIVAALELGRRAHRPPPAPPRLVRPSDAFRQVADLGRAKKEHLVGLYLDAQNGLLHRETISVGTLNTTRTHPREILYPAIVHLALGFILAHNHPSGCPDPSEEDVAFTRAVHRAGEMMGIELYDHLIVTPAGFTSLRERGAF